jgi:hypothetical protein
MITCVHRKKTGLRGGGWEKETLILSTLWKLPFNEILPDSRLL